MNVTQNTNTLSHREVRGKGPPEDEKRDQALRSQDERGGREGGLYLWILLYASCSSWHRILGSSTADSRHTFPMVT